MSILLSDLYQLGTVCSAQSVTSMVLGPFSFLDLISISNFKCLFLICDCLFLIPASPKTVVSLASLLTIILAYHN